MMLMFILFVTMNIKSSSLWHILIYKNCKNVEEKVHAKFKTNPDKTPDDWTNMFYMKKKHIWTEYEQNVNSSIL